MAKPKAKPRIPQQFHGDKWYAIAYGGEPLLEECCDCALVYRVEHKIENGRIWVRYDPDEALTRVARRRRRKTGERLIQDERK